jgi:hypothetical protein
MQTTNHHNPNEPDSYTILGIGMLQGLSLGQSSKWNLPRTIETVFGTATLNLSTLHYEAADCNVAKVVRTDSLIRPTIWGMVEACETVTG